MKIIITRRPDDYHACEEGNPGVWESGKTVMEALGNLIFTLRVQLNIEVKIKIDN